MASRSESFDEFVRANAADFVRVAHLVTWDEAEAEDVVQECLIRVAKRWPKVRTMEHPIAYARRIAVNLALEGQRRHSVEQIELTGAASLVVDERATASAESLTNRSELIDALGQLPRHQRAVLGLRYFLDLSEAETAALLGCSTGTVKSAASRGLAQLRELIVPIWPSSEVCDS